MWTAVLSSGQALESAVSQVPDDTFLIVTVVVVLAMLLEIASWLGGPPAASQSNKVTDKRVLQAQLINRMVQEAGYAPRRTSASSASGNASPTKIAKSLKMPQAPALHTLSSNVSQASTDTHSSSSSTNGLDDDENESIHRQDVK
jgi:hypothetical protein